MELTHKQIAKEVFKFIKRFRMRKLRVKEKRKMEEEEEKNTIKLLSSNHII